MIVVVPQCFCRNDTSSATENRGCEGKDDNSNKGNSDAMSNSIMRPGFFFFFLINFLYFLNETYWRRNGLVISITGYPF